jgi:hypothetical protein
MAAKGLLKNVFFFHSSGLIIIIIFDRICKHGELDAAEAKKLDSLAKNKERRWRRVSEGIVAEVKRLMADK